MAYCITLSTAATKTAYQRFGDAYISALSQAVPGLNVEQCQAILSDVIATVGRKVPKEKKPKKEKKAPKTPSPSKRDLKKHELIGELKSYGEHAGALPDVSTTSIGDLRKLITAAKKSKKAAEKLAAAQKKAKKSPKKAKKSPKKAAASEPTMSKRELKKIELWKEIKALGGDVPDTEKPICDYSVTELRAIIKSLTPKKKKGRKPKKAVAQAEADHEALLSTLADSLKAAETKDSAPAKVEKPKLTYEFVEPACSVASITSFHGGANGEVVATKLYTAPTKKLNPEEKSDAPADQKIEADDSSSEEEESELELDSDDDVSSSEEDESDNED